VLHSAVTSDEGCDGRDDGAIAPSVHQEHGGAYRFARWHGAASGAFDGEKPGTGIPAAHLSGLLGRTLRCTVARDQCLEEAHLV
jgi:hypothetical protein